jgi:hypothetical protein
MQEQAMRTIWWSVALTAILVLWCLKAYAWLWRTAPPVAALVTASGVVAYLVCVNGRLD